MTQPLHKYLALLRGINVGGNNIIRMVDLKASFEAMGFSAVVTYIQSGNVIFDSAETNRQKLITLIEQHLSERFSFKARIVLVTRAQLENAVRKAPEAFGEAPDLYRYDVIFLKEPLLPAEAMQSVTVREGVDTAYAGEDVLYFSRLISRATQSYLSKLILMPVYKNMSIRNWNTTTKVLTLMNS